MAHNPFHTEPPEPGLFVRGLNPIFGETGRQAQQRQQREIGSVQAGLFPEIMARVEQGMPLDRAILDFMSTPEGMQALQTDPQAITRFAQNMTAIKPQVETIPPGHGVRTRDLMGQTTGIDVPVPAGPAAEVQGLMDLLQGGDMSAAERQEIQDAAVLARLASTGQGSGTAAERAMSGLIAKGLISPEQAQMMLAGTISIWPLQHPTTGLPLGVTMFNALTGETAMLGGAPGIPGPQATPGQPTPGADLPPQLQGTPTRAQPADRMGFPEPMFAAPGRVHRPMPGLESRAEMFLGAGAVPWAIDMAAGVARQVNNRSQLGIMQRNRRQALNVLRTGGVTFLQHGGTLGIPKVLLDRVEDLVDFTSVLDDPVGATFSALQTADLLDSLMEEERVVANDRTRAAATQQAADQRLRLLQTFRNYLPPQADMIELLNRFEAGEIAADDPTGALGEFRRTIQERGGAEGTPEIPALSTNPVRFQEEWDALEPGALYRHPDGSVRRKRGTAVTPRQELPNAQ
jgi:hypothetical protein